MKPFLPIPEAATRSRLILVSDDRDRLSFILPRAFSDTDGAGSAVGIDSAVGDIGGTTTEVSAS